MIRHLNNTQIQQPTSQHLIDALAEITTCIDQFKRLRTLTAETFLPIRVKTVELITNNTLEEINKKIKYFTQGSSTEIAEEYQAIITKINNQAVEWEEQIKEALKDTLKVGDTIPQEVLVKAHQHKLIEHKRIRTAEHKKALEEYIEKKYVLLINSQNSEEGKQKIVSEYKEQISLLNQENLQNLQHQELNQRVGYKVCNITAHPLVESGILTQEEIAPIASSYEILNILGEYNNSTGLYHVRQLFNIARNFYPNDAAKGFNELTEIPYNKVSLLVYNTAIFKLLNAKLITFPCIKNIDENKAQFIISHISIIETMGKHDVDIKKFLTLNVDDAQTIVTHYEFLKTTFKQNFNAVVLNSCAQSNIKLIIKHDQLVAKGLAHNIHYYSQLLTLNEDKIQCLINTSTLHFDQNSILHHVDLELPLYGNFTYNSDYGI